MKLCCGAYHLIRAGTTGLYNRISNRNGISSLSDINREVLSNDIWMLMLGCLITTNLCILSNDLGTIDTDHVYHNKHKLISDLLLLLHN